MKETIKTMRDMLPDFIEEQYPKGKNENRGEATVAIALFLVWFEKQLN